MKKKVYVVDDLAAIYVFVMGIILTIVVFMAQSMNTDLVGTERYLFLAGFVGSFVGTLFRLGLQCIRLYNQKGFIRKYIGLLCTVICTIIVIGSLVVVLVCSEFSMAFNYLRYYLTFQYFGVGMLIIQWFNQKLFEEEWTFLPCAKKK